MLIWTSFETIFQEVSIYMATSCIWCSFKPVQGFFQVTYLLFFALTRWLSNINFFSRKLFINATWYLFDKLSIPFELPMQVQFRLSQVEAQVQTLLDNQHFTFVCNVSPSSMICTSELLLMSLTLFCNFTSRGLFHLGNRQVHESCFFD